VPLPASIRWKIGRMSGVAWGRISKQGSRWLRFYLVEAGQVAMRKDADLARVYQRISRRGGSC
jgi:hypothetical protein